MHICGIFGTALGWHKCLALAQGQIRMALSVNLAEIICLLQLTIEPFRQCLFNQIILSLEAWYTFKINLYLPSPEAPPTCIPSAFSPLTPMKNKNIKQRANGFKCVIWPFMCEFWKWHLWGDPRPDGLNPYPGLPIHLLCLLSARDKL